MSETFEFGHKALKLSIKSKVVNIGVIVSR
jgi:hypothetical protein